MPKTQKEKNKIKKASLLNEPECWLLASPESSLGVSLKCRSKYRREGGPFQASPEENNPDFFYHEKVLKRDSRPVSEL